MNAAAAPPLYGLVLAGGRSTRMQRDKAAIEYRPGETQLDAAMKLLRPRVARAFVSVRAEQRADAARSAWEQIVDRGDVDGPIAGISAALAEHPDAAWLVLACDLPFLDARTLDTLIAARDRGGDATAFRSSHDGLPEPLCAIYEPRARASHGGAHRQRPQLPAQIPDQCADAPARAAESARARQREHRGGVWRGHVGPERHRSIRAREIRVQYYALLREQAGRSDETLHTRARTPRELYVELRAKYPFTLPPGNAARGRQRGIRRLVAAARGRRCRGVHSSGGRRMSSAHRTRSRFSEQPLDTAALQRELRDDSCGGFAAFEGWVRNHNEGHAVTRLEYEAFVELAEKEGARIVAEAVRALRRHARRLRASRRVAGDRRRRRLGGRERRASRRGVPRLPLHHRRSETPRPDLEEGTLRQRRFGLGQLRACALHGARCNN